ncbi:Imm48 family immunity protein [Clostridium sp. ZBS4]|uniref:Imm48 family immunity protein n=1 Tax=Clostridium sp. ZBS4 TaxID=2949974 RepID=UPI00207AC659|nr:Imm48 family immunity protein [Clostridium sp. ZBS4]
MEDRKVIFIKDCEIMSNKLFDVMEMSFEDTTEFDKQILSILSFGMINAYAMEEKISVDIVNITSEYVLIKVFKYSNEQAHTFLEKMIEGTRKEKNPVYYHIIHQGIEMFYEYGKYEKDAMFDRIIKIYLLLGNS